MVPRTWYHICIGIDTDSGLLRIVDNGVQAFNGKNDYLENTASMKPKSLAGKLLGNGYFVFMHHLCLKHSKIKLWRWIKQS